MAVSHAPARGGAAVALLVLVPALLFAMHRLGDLVPAVIMLGLAALAVWAVPRFPSSPIACLDTRAGCRTDHQLTWLCALAFIVPLGAAVGYKARRSDKPGFTGTRPVFRRGRRP